MIYITGDTHRLRGVQRIIDFCNTKEITEEDKLVICGDSSIIWVGGEDDAQVIRRYEEIWRGLILYIDGNHENFDLLDAFPVTEWNGGKVHKIGDRIYHLMRGQIFEIEGKKFFTLGGNETHNRKGYLWERERITEEDIAEAERTLAAHNNEVDIIVTHCASDCALEEMRSKTGLKRFAGNNESAEISKLLRNVQYKKWYIGHYHKDEQIGKQIFVYGSIYTE